jgi:hypothetical protein
VAEVAWIAFVFLASVRFPVVRARLRWHMDAAQRLLDTGTPYWPWQVAAPYGIGSGAILYPPVAFALFIPFLWLPAVLWWAIPVAVTVWAIPGTTLRCGRG